MQGTFTEPMIEVYIEIAKAYTQGVKFFGQTEFFEERQAFFFTQHSKEIAAPVDDALGCFHNVLTVIAVFRKFTLHIEELHVTGINRFSQVINLITGVIDVVFRFYFVARSTQ